MAASRDSFPHVNDISMFNWPSNDYSDPQVLLGSAHQVAQSLQAAKQLSLGFLHWLHTEAPADGTRLGAPELLLRRDVLDTVDGLAKHPYVRESRRIAAHKVIVEQDVAVQFHDGPRAKHYDDSVGLGWYPIDIHPSGLDEVAASTATRPFQIPLGSLIPVGLTNVIAGAKNIGTTHITNGCFRLHPVECNIGESAGLLAAFSLRNGVPVVDVYRDPSPRRAFQAHLLREGVPLYWLIDYPPGHPHFVAVQKLCMAGALSDSADLAFKPDHPVTADIWTRAGGHGDVPHNLAEAVRVLARLPS